jgi:uncharacterized protein (TIGR03032 family)
VKSRPGTARRPDRDHDAAWRDPAEVVGFTREARLSDPRLLESETQGAFWDILAEHQITLLVSREYEHLLVALSAEGRRRRTTCFPLPHPSGIAVDRRRRVAYVASTRNPNQVHRFRAVDELMPRSDLRSRRRPDRPLVPVSTRNHPGCLYLHDLALVGRALFASATGQNAVVRLDAEGGAQPVWWPRCVDASKEAGPRFGRNEIQLNSIAAGSTLAASYFTASAAEPSSRRPGSRGFLVDRRGVVFGGRSRTPVTRGLTRPHSARLHRRRLWVANSGYGELVLCELPSERFRVVARLPGWTRGMCHRDGIAFVGTSRVLPRFRHYAPGLDARRSRCGVHAVELRTGRVLGSLLWPAGDQIFAIEWIQSSWSQGLPLPAADGRTRDLFYAFKVR